MTQDASDTCTSNKYIDLSAKYPAKYNAVIATKPISCLISL
ncbi:hypothetical protein NT04LM_4615, partial [Listeria monocytogenes FSL F2-208]